MTSTIKVNKIEKESGSTLTIGGACTAVTLACGATQSGFGTPSSSVLWCTTAKTSPFTAASKVGYFVNTSGGTITVTLPSSPSAGDVVAIKDYGNTFNTNKVTLGRGGSKINGECNDAFLETQGQAVELIYVDGTKGWQDINDSTSDVTGSSFITATGGTITTVCTNFKVHTFTSTGTFCVSAGSGPLASLSYVVVAGGGGSAGDRGGGGGAGGFREGKDSSTPYTASPLDAGSGMTGLVPGSYPVTIGAGGAANNSPPYSSNGANGGNTIFNGITSAGGGGGGRVPPGTGSNGGSGGGAGNVSPHAAVDGGSGNTPPVSPPQGNPGGQNGDSVPRYSTGGGGGAGVAGGNATQCVGGAAGDGVTTNITASPVGYTGGGGGSNDNGGTPKPINPAFGGGAAATADSGTPGQNAVANKGGGGGGSAGSTDGGDGGSGVVIIRYKFQ
jgi:hypothetical protein